MQQAFSLTTVSEHADGCQTIVYNQYIKQKYQLKQSLSRCCVDATQILKLCLKPLVMLPVILWQFDRFQNIQAVYIKTHSSGLTSLTLENTNYFSINTPIKLTDCPLTHHCFITQTGMGKQMKCLSVDGHFVFCSCFYKKGTHGFSGLLKQTLPVREVLA